MTTEWNLSGTREPIWGYGGPDFSTTISDDCGTVSDGCVVHAYISYPYGSCSLKFIQSFVNKSTGFDPVISFTF